MNIWLQFSDAAKYADIARNIVNGKGFVSSFSFFREDLFNYTGQYFSGSSVPKLYPYLLSIFFRFFGVNDPSVLLLSWISFILVLIVGYLFARKLFGKLAALIFLLSLAFYINLIEFAHTGASEMFFILELLMSFYLITFKDMRIQAGGLIVSLLMYFTRPQAILFMIPVFFYFVIRNFSFKRAFQIFTILLVGFLLFDNLYFKQVNKRSVLYPIVVRGMEASMFYYPGEGTSNRLRGGSVIPLQSVEIAKKTFYNMYNFYRLIPNYMSPYLFVFFVLSLFWWNKDKVENRLKLSILLMLLVIYLTTAVTIPLLRYLIPVVPFIYLFAVERLVWIVRQIFNLQFSIFKKIIIFNFKITKQKLVILTSLFLILFLAVGQTLGMIFLDSRFERKTHNIGKPPVYVTLSKILKENTDPDDVIVTNLDTWGSWYGERQTVWFPLEPEMLIPPDGVEKPFDAIYLTNYLIDDENYYMGEGWKQIFADPNNIENEYLNNTYELVGEFNIGPSETYEKTEGRAILLVRK